MASKPKRSLASVGESQRKTEERVSNKFSETAPIAQGNASKKETKGERISPQLSCTIGIEEKKMLDELTLFASNKAGKIINTSTVLRALIRFGRKKKEELEF